MLRAISDFADALRRLPRVLLILDTCEELAKADVGDPAASAVTTAFQILERIHKRAPNVRILFAGRRPLPAHDYLTVQPVTGFTAEEARQYLAAVAHPLLREDLADAMIRQSPAVDDPARVSPFDLALYRSWADEDPGLTAEQVARGSDAYIEGRIIERLGDADVLRALPALATAGRCRVMTIADFLDVHPASLGPRLAEQEWIEGRKERDDWQTPDLDQAIRAACEAKALGGREEYERLRGKALSLIWTSPSLTSANQRQLAKAVQEKLDGVVPGAVADGEPTVAAIVAEHGLPSPDSVSDLTLSALLAT